MLDISEKRRILEQNKNYKDVLMTKEKILKYIKIALFWLLYAVFMVFNLGSIALLGSSLFFEIFDPKFWLEHYTMYPYGIVVYPTPLPQKLYSCFLILLIAVLTIWGNYRLYKKKKGALWFLAILVYANVINILIEIFS